MKRENRHGLSAMFVVSIIFVVLTVGFIAWQVVNNDDNPTSARTTTQTPEESNDCGVDRQCFYQAFSSDCTQKIIKVTQTTTEGDPIVTTAKVAQGYEGCVVEATVDGRQDKFGDGKVHAYICGKLAQEGQKLTASECTGSTKAPSIVI
jgi:hypothetical protein